MEHRVDDSLCDGNGEGICHRNTLQVESEVSAGRDSVEETHLDPRKTYVSNKESTSVVPSKFAMEHSDGKLY